MESMHELVIPNEDLPFKMFVFEGKNGNYIRTKHWHRSVEIFAVFEGELEFYVNEKQYVLTSGELILVNSNEVHSIFAPNQNFTVVLQIPIDVFAAYYTEENFIFFSRECEGQKASILDLIRKMYVWYGEKKEAYELQIKSAFYMLLYLLVTQCREEQVSDEAMRQSRKLTRLSMITDYMKENYRKELTLESVACRFGYSPTYLSKMFRKYAQTNYRTYLQDIRVEYARQELVGTERTISDIAIDHGFPNSKAFAKTFRKKYGILPSKYREMHAGQK